MRRLTRTTLAGSCLFGTTLVAGAAPADALTLWTKGFAPVADLEGGGTVVREVLEEVGCSRGNRFTVELTLTQGDATAIGRREFECAGDVRDTMIVIHATSGSFQIGTAHVDAIGTERDKSGAVVDLEHRSPDITLSD